MIQSKTVIREFGNSMGIEGLSLNREGCISLAFEGMGTLHMEQAGERLLICLGRAVPPP